MQVKRIIKLYVIPISLLIAIGAYSFFWFLLQKNIEQFEKFLQLDTPVWKISYQKAELSGFPFKFKLTIHDLSIKFDSKPLKLRVETKLDKISAETGPLLNEITFTLPNKVTLDFFYRNSFNKWLMESSKMASLKIKEAGWINTLKIIDIINNPEVFNEQEYSLEQVEFRYEDCNFTNLNINKKIFSSDSYNKLLIDDSGDLFYKASVEARNKLKFIDNEYLGYNFKNAAYEVDVSAKLKRVQDNLAQIPLIDIKKFKFNIDDFYFNLNGSIKQTDSSGFKISFDTSLVKFPEFLDQLVENKSISDSKKQFLVNSLMKISGSDNIEAVNIKVYNLKDSSLRVGDVSVEEFMDIMSQYNSVK